MAETCGDRERKDGSRRKASRIAEVYVHYTCRKERSLSLFWAFYYTPFLRLTLTRSEEYDKTVSELKEEVQSLRNEKTLSQREIDSLHSKQMQQKVLDAQHSKVSLFLPLKLQFFIDCGLDNTITKYKHLHYTLCHSILLFMFCLHWYQLYMYFHAWHSYC